MRSLVIAPHPDDELLGCGGTLLQRHSAGSTIGWLLITSLTSEQASSDRISTRLTEIDNVRLGLNISKDHFYSLGFPTIELDQIPLSTLITSISTVFQNFCPN